MPAREIPRHQWVAFLDGFSGQHEGWLSTLEVSEADGRGRLDESEQPLIGITAELDSGHDVIAIVLGAKSVAPITHVIDGATRLWVEETPQGAHEGLRIESKRGDSTALRFRSAVLPQSVDGIGPVA